MENELKQHRHELWNRDFILILLVVVFAAFTHNAFIVVLPVYVNEIGGSNTISGFMLTGLMISGIITRIIFGPLIDKVGRKKILLIGCFLFMVNTFAYYFITSLTGIFILRIINGISQGIFFPVPPTIVGDVVSDRKLVDGLSFFGISAAMSASIAPSVGMAIYRNHGASGLFILTSIFALAAFVLALFLKENYRPLETRVKKQKGEKVKLKISGINTVIELAVILPAMIALIISVGNSSITNFLGPFGLSRGIVNIGLFFFMQNVVIIITRLFTGRLVQRFGSISLITTGGILIITGAMIIAFSYTIVPVIIASIIFGMGISLTTQILQVLVFRMSTVNRRGVANSTHMLFGDIGLGIGAMVFGALSERQGYTVTYVISAIVMFVALMIHLMVLVPKLTIGDTAVEKAIS